MNNFRSARKLKQLTQAEVADELGLTRSAYVHYEQGDRECSFDTLRKLSNRFDVTIDYLLGNDNARDETLPKEENSLLKGFRSLSADGKAALLTVLDSLKVTHSVAK